MNIGIIPARYASTRFPGKPLVDIKGKSMIQRVYEQCEKVPELNVLIVATDDEKIYNHVKTFGGRAIMTSAEHQSGTDRCNEAASLIGAKPEDIIINIQGDEPFIVPEQVKLLISIMQDNKKQIGTLIKKIDTPQELFDPNKPKVVKDHSGKALYFSRSVIPFVRLAENTEWILNHKFYKHIGIYAFRFEILKKISALSQTSLEIAESLEQLRWLENGFGIFTAETSIESISIDTPEDLERINLTDI
jgi:3-deoxy-manno-octulosonate cytidylyltransferase (CMP-KDO synthetase)